MRAAGAARAMADARVRAIAFLAHRHHFRIWEALPWVLALATFILPAVNLLPDRMLFGSQVLLMVLFALSLDLILGFAGIVSLGHAAFFGIGAYTAALLTVRLGWEEQISGLVAAAAVAAAAGAATGVVLLRYRGLTLLVLTLATAIMLQELGNILRDLTGGYDGLPGLMFKPLLGRFDYDLLGHVAYLYALAVLFVLFVLVRMIVHSPFGQTLAGIRENVARMHAIGSPVHLRLVTVYTISAAIAGVAGALFTQTNQYVTLGVFDFDNSAGVMVMLILGGTGRLYGAFVGAVIYMVLQDYVSKLKLTVWGLAVDGPQYWQFAVGLLLVLTVLFARRGLLGLFEDAAKLFVRERKP
jgi:branched-chain amino acid transport system permease protein